MKQHIIITLIASVLFGSTITASAQKLTNVIVKPKSVFTLDGQAFIDAGDLEFIDGTASLTISTWVRPTALNNRQTLFSKQNTCNHSPEGFLLLVDPDGSLLYILADTLDRRIQFSTDPGMMTTDKWQHVAIVFDGSQVDVTDKIKLYLDGDLITVNFELDYPHTQTTTTDVSFKIGMTKDSNCQKFGFIGEVSEANIIEEPLRRGQIRLLKDATKPIQ